MQTTKIYKTTIVFVLSILISSFSFAQEDNKWSKILKDYKIKAGVGFQVWSTYTVDQEIFDSALGDYVKVDNRLNFELHRSRFSLSGQPYPNLKFNATAAFDFVGRDALAATQGGNNNGPRGEFGLWGFYLRWQPNINSDLLHITGGFMPPQIGRESITA
ncbi:MAG: hypothetical protein HKN51_01760, partial [Saprospiraceae bacterium]|nr:hypothetical protein [Saprospiraceae bacterium]